MAHNILTESYGNFGKISTNMSKTTSVNEFLTDFRHLATILLPGGILAVSLVLLLPPEQASKLVILPLNSLGAIAFIGFCYLLGQTNSKISFPFSAWIEYIGRGNRDKVLRREITDLCQFGDYNLFLHLLKQFKIKENIDCRSIYKLVNDCRACLLGTESYNHLKDEQTRIISTYHLTLPLLILFACSIASPILDNSFWIRMSIGILLLIWLYRVRDSHITRLNEIRSVFWCYARANKILTDETENMSPLDM